MEETQTNIVPTKKEAKASKRAKRKKNGFLEILRFVVVGVICTLIDAGIFYVLMRFAFPWLAEMGGENGWGGYAAWGISTTISFLCSAIVNFFFSRLWVYQNVDKKIKTNNAKTFWAYLGLAVLGWLIGLGVQELGVFLCNTYWPELNLTINFTKVSWSELWNEAGWSFWAFVIIFCAKTIITMIYNYTTRKLIIFKAPKKEEEEPFDVSPSITEGAVVTAVEPIEVKPVDEEPKPKAKVTNWTTMESFKKIFKEEYEKKNPEYNKKTYSIDARRIVREEIAAHEEKYGVGNSSH